MVHTDKRKIAWEFWNLNFLNFFFIELSNQLSNWSNHLRCIKKYFLIQRKQSYLQHLFVYPFPIEGTICRSKHRIHFSNTEFPIPIQIDRFTTTKNWFAFFLHCANLTRTVRFGIFFPSFLFLISQREWILKRWKKYAKTKWYQCAHGICRPMIWYISIANQYVNKNQSKLETNKMVFCVHVYYYRCQHQFSSYIHLKSLWKF